MEMPELLPCPFCGHEVRFHHNLDGEIGGIYCNWCKAHVRFTDIEPKKSDTFGKTMEQYAQKYNRRDAVDVVVRNSGNGVAVGVIHGGLKIER